ncbi:radical SAM family heme chaperone HemW [Selenomonas ruminis]|uniref:Heme chaperone HemW n=1 Tax=Selenomonas ruminis TaxID=2593411 RepID=A0A5D6W9K8_9FIRM|nr:radical SAM family heme chaperone HemW [Selenomonas sp. mPRGC5]TYZ23408.1 radical SAM family heme chaperone HemW [Selenomonas sp. mPRGC5]
MDAKQWGVYVHIPFCRQKCFYCDFPSFAGRERYMEDYTGALCREIAVRGSYYRQLWGRPATIYLGGGTPSILPANLMGKLLKKIRQVFLEDGEAEEFTVECNPGTVDEEYLLLLREYGVNRLSFGVQSFDDELLRRIGRIHNGQQAIDAVNMAKRAGFTNLSLDLMYGLPGQKLEQLKASVKQALALEPKHISIYGLQLEEGTVFSRMQAMGKLELPDDEATEAMYDYMTEFLPQQGYERYEISNFARPGFASRHNRSYWQDVPYLGLGAAAHSYLNGQRWAAYAELGRYMEAIQEKKSPVEPEESATAAIAIEEFCFLALRTAEGISREKFQRKFGRNLDDLYGTIIRDFCQKKLLADDGVQVYLTSQGMKYGNLVFEKFLLDEQDF